MSLNFRFPPFKIFLGLLLKPPMPFKETLNGHFTVKTNCHYEIKLSITKRILGRHKTHYNVHNINNNNNTTPPPPPLPLTPWL
jgi:hypothetical protein